jgi:ribosomal RNA assembly protein
MVEGDIHIKLPYERIGVIIGSDGSVKRMLEDALQVAISVDSSTGDICLKINTELRDPTIIFRARDIITAIGRGFPPKKALKLLDENFSLIILDLKDYFGKSQSDIKRIKGRIIGESGKTRSMIEELTWTDMSVYGDTIGIIGEPEQLRVAEEAVDMLIRGMQHRSVYQFLFRERTGLKRSHMELWERKEI